MLFRSPRFLAGLRKFADHPLVGEADGVGLIGAIQLVKSKAPREFFDPTQAVAAYFAGRAQEHGLIVRPLFGDRVALCPPLVIGEEQIDEMLGLLDAPALTAAELAAIEQVWARDCAES